MPEQGCDGKTRPAKRHVNYPDALKVRLIRLLELRYDRNVSDVDERPISAAVLARALKHWPGQKREAQRRRVRELVQEAREEGAPIASWSRGYSIAREVEDFQKTEDFLRRHGIATLATNARLKRTAAHDRAHGQTRLPSLHAVLTGRCGLDLYRKPDSTPAQPTDPSAAGRSGTEALTAEQSGQEWSDSLFAFA